MTIVHDGLGTTLAALTSGLVVTKTRITPPAVEGGDPIDMTSLENTAWRTAKPKTLKALENVSFEGQYDPSKLVSAPINVNQVWTLTYPDGSRHVFWAWLRRFEGGDLVEGDKAPCTGTLEVSNLNSSSVETAPVYYTSTQTRTGTATA